MSQTTAIILAAGQGKRMNSKIRKQYLEIDQKPILYYTLSAFERSFIDKIVLVVGEGEVEYCQKNIVEKYNFKKVTKIVVGGKERYHSVYEGLKEITWENDFSFIHDGARPFVTNDMLERALQTVQKTKACVVGMPVKDTVKIADDDLYVKETPDRSKVWQIQTPQVFEHELIFDCYSKLIKEEKNIIAQGIKITDDAMVAEYYSDVKIKLVEGSYMNIKITTPEDMGIAEVFLQYN